MGSRRWCIRYCAYCTFLAACGGSGTGGGAGGAALKSNLGVDLTSVIGFAIVKVPTTSMRVAPATTDAGTCMASTLYAVMADGTMVQTTVTADPMGGCDTSMTTERASAVFDTAKYDIFNYSPPIAAPETGDPGHTLISVILRKSDGALFDLGTGDPAGVSRVRTDASGDQLAVGIDQGLYHIDLTGSPQSTTLNDPQMSMLSVSTFNVDGTGDILAQLDGSGVQFGALRVFKPNGGLDNIVASGADGQWFNSADGNFYYGVTQSGPITFFQLSPAFTSTMVGSANAILLGSDPALVTASQAYAAESAGDIVELIGATSGTKHAVPGVALINAAYGADTTLFVQGTDMAGNGTIVSTDVSTFTWTTLLAAGDYTLTASALSKTGELTFAGLRNADGAHVIGNCNPTCTVLTATAPQVTDLVRIN
jgi:hypothetical protein